MKECDICHCTYSNGNDYYNLEYLELETGERKWLIGHFDCLEQFRRIHYRISEAGVIITNRRNEMNLKQRIERLESKVFEDMYKCPVCGIKIKMHHGTETHCTGCGSGLTLYGNALTCKVPACNYQVT